MISETRGTGWYYFPGPVAFLVLIGILLVLFESTFPTYSLGTSSSRSIVLEGLLVLFLLGLIWLLYRYILWISTVYAVTNRRVIVQRGILSLEMNEIPVEQVRGVDVYQSIVQRLLGYGRMKVSSESGRTLGNEDWVGVPNPFQFQKLIENASIARDTQPRAVYVVQPPGAPGAPSLARP